jgi:hypothetical protein
LSVSPRFSADGNGFSQSLRMLGGEKAWVLGRGNLTPKNVIPSVPRLVALWEIFGAAMIRPGGTPGP